MCVPGASAARAWAPLSLETPPGEAARKERESTGPQVVWEGSQEEEGTLGTAEGQR